MSIRFDGTDAMRYTATTGLPASKTLFSVTMWVYISVDRNKDNGPFAFSSLTSGGGTTTLRLSCGADGTTMEAWDATGLIAGTGFSMTVGQWYKLGFTVNGTNGVFYRADAVSALTTVSTSTFAAAVALALVSVGGDQYNTDAWNGRIAALKVWDAALTQTEIEDELGQYLPVRTASLLRSHPFVTAEQADYSGNNNTLTAGGSAATTEDGPGIPWGRFRSRSVKVNPLLPIVDAGQDRLGTVNFEVAIQAYEAALAVTSRSWVVISGPAEVSNTIGTASLLSWFPTTAGVYVLEYSVTNSAGTAADRVTVTANAGGSVINSASISSTTTTLTCNKPTNTAVDDVMLAVQSGDFANADLMTPPAGWQPLFAYDVGLDSLHIKGWTLTAGASEPSTYAFAQGTSSNGVVTITTMRGVVEAGIRWDITYDATTTATRVAPTLDVAVPGSVLLCGAMGDPGAARTWTPPGGMTEQSDLQAGTTNTTHTVASLLDPGQPTGTKSFTASGLLAAVGGIQWSAAFQMPYEPDRGVNNKSMMSFVRAL